MSRVGEAQQKVRDAAGQYRRRWGVDPEEPLLRVFELKALWELLEQQEQDLAQEQAVNAANTKTLRILKAAVCKAAYLLAMPGSEAANLTGFEKAQCDSPLHEGEPCTAHAHPLYSPDAIEALADLAALDDSAYAPAFGALEGATG